MPAPAGHHRRRERARERDRRAQVDLEHRVDLRLAEIEQVAGGRQRGVGDEDVDVRGFGREPLDVAARGQVGGDRARSKLGRPAA